MDLKQTRKTYFTDNNQEPKLIINEILVNLSKLKQKTIYCQLISNIVAIPTAKKRFNEAYPDANLDWKKLYQLHFKVTTDTRTRQFQYKILNRILYTNKALFKWSIVEIAKCAFCNIHEETVVHVFYNCTNTQFFWKEVSISMSENLSSNTRTFKRN